MDLLVGDIGGTNARFGLVGENEVRPHEVSTEAGDDHPNFESAVEAYLGRLERKPSRAAFAVAGPVAEGRARATNRRDWVIDEGRLAARFGFSHVEVMNDFVAQAASLPHLGPDETVRIGDPGPSDDTKVAVGPGTGLGVAALLRDGDGWRPLASEGGHIEFAAIDARETTAFDLMRRDLGRVSAEDVLSGPGLSRLHAALAAVDGVGGPTLEPAAIVSAAKAGEARARATVETFLGMLARFTGDVALTFGAFGGVYLCGGVAPRLLDLLEPRAFRAAFEAKRPHEGLMRRTATMVVTSPGAGLIGCAAVAGNRR